MTHALYLKPSEVIW